MLDRVVKYSEQYSLNINISKTKMMIFAKTPKTTIKVNNRVIEQVESFRYLGTQITQNCERKKEIRSRIEQARKMFTSMKQFFTRSEINLTLRVRMLR